MKTANQAMQYETMKVRPFKRTTKSQVDKKVFRAMTSRQIIVSSLSVLYGRHSVGFWQLTTSVIFICLIVSNI